VYVGEKVNNGTFLPYLELYLRAILTGVDIIEYCPAGGKGSIDEIIDLQFQHNNGYI
jgi:hypothetical protein